MRLSFLVMREREIATHSRAVVVDQERELVEVQSNLVGMVLTLVHREEDGEVEEARYMIGEDRRSQLVLDISPQREEGYRDRSQHQQDPRRCQRIEIAVDPLHPP